MVGQCVLCHAPRLKGAYWSNDVHKIRFNHGAISDAINKWEELNNIQDDSLPQSLWSRYFIEVQGYAVKDIKFHQDNISAILMVNI